MSETETTKTEPIIGEFKPKRKFLNFVSAVNGAKIRFLRDVAFIKGEKLSGILEGVVFKVTICDEGTIKFEEVDTKKSDKAMIGRFIDEIDSTDVTGYAQKFVVAGFEFHDIDGKRCYLEVEHQKPIDKLKSLFDDEPKLSDKGASLLDSLFGTDDEVESVTSEEEVVEEKSETKTDDKKTAAKSYMEEQFRKMNEDKVNELKSRIENSEKESIKLRSEIAHSESRLKKITEDLGVLETRLDSFNEKDQPNGYVFYVSEEQKPEDIGLSDENKTVVDKIADIMGLKKDVLFKMLTEGYYTIKIAEKDKIGDEKVKVKAEVASKIMTLVLSDKSADAKVTSNGNGEFEYRGSHTWHQLLGKMLKMGFEQDPEFDKVCNSNSYESKEEKTETKTDDSSIILKKRKKKKND